MGKPLKVSELTVNHKIGILLFALLIALLYGSHEIMDLKMLSSLKHTSICNTFSNVISNSNVLSTFIKVVLTC